MNINTNYAVSCRANAKPAIKQFSYLLENGQKVNCRHNKNLFEVIVSENTPKGERVVSGSGHYNGRGMRFADCTHILDKMKDTIKDSNRFLDEFFKSLRTK